MADKTFKVTFLQDEITALDQLERGCNFAETELFAELISLERASLHTGDAGGEPTLTPCTLATLKKPTQIDSGRLIFLFPPQGMTQEQFEAQQKQLNRVFAFSGDAIVNKEKVKVAVFRPKAT
jgi:hypothetical protein